MVMSINHTLGKVLILNQDKIVFFLHLLGMDTNGHVNKPYSRSSIDTESIFLHLLGMDTNGHGNKPYSR